jgi:hypothetical protein
MSQSRVGKDIAPGVVRLTGVQSPVELVTVKIPGTTLEDHGDGTATVRLPAGTAGGRGGLNLCRDANGEFHVACVVPLPEGVKE